jgi:tricorn protease
VVGINLEHPLVDKGSSTRPSGAFFDLERRWGVEGEGVHPDIVVDNDPGAEFRGVDAQLDRALTEMLGLLAKDPPKPPDFGPSPDKRKKTWVETYGQEDQP